MKRKINVTSAKTLYNNYLSWLRRNPRNSRTIWNIAKIGRNEKCPCGSGLKHKSCCWKDLNTTDEETPEVTRYIKKENRFWKKKYKKLTENQPVAKADTPKIITEFNKEQFEKLRKNVNEGSKNK